MKNILWTSACIAMLALQATAQEQHGAAANNRSESKVEPTIVERGPHHRVWERRTVQVLPIGRSVTNRSSYTELATGMHYQKDGQWLESKEKIELFEGAAAALQGQHKAVFSQNINTKGGILVIAPDGSRLRSHVLGLAYTDAASGQSVLISGPRDSIGEVGGNQVYYRNAFDGGFRADMRYTYTRGGFEQDVVIRESPPSPKQFGFNPETTRLEVWTEFIESGDPVKSVTALKTLDDPALRQEMADPDLTDEMLGFGAMWIGRGNAFPIEQNGAERDGGTTPVGKSWIMLEGRRFLIEKVDYKDVEAQLAELPKSASVAKPRTNLQQAGIGRNSRLGLLAGLNSPERSKGEIGAAPMRMASAMPAEKGFVLDYVLASTQTNGTFHADKTYYLSGTVSLSGTNSFEGGAVFKYANNASLGLISVNSNLNWRATPYRPVIFTSKDDDTVGETINGSTGVPTNYYGKPALYIVAGGNLTLENLRFSWAKQAIEVVGTTIAFLNVQLVKCDGGASFSSGGASLRNALFSGIRTNLHLYQGTFNLQNVTFNDSLYLTTLASNNSATLTITNCVFANITNLYPYSPSQLSAGYNGFHRSATFGSATFTNTTFPFQTFGAAGYYLTTNSPYRNVATTNVDSTLLSYLRKRTTYPPLLYGSGALFTNSLTLSVQAQRDVDVPDLGYHYDPLDYVFSGLYLTNATITAQAGVAIGIRTPFNTGLGLLGGANFYCEGTPDNLNRIVRYNTVQEQSNTNWTEFANNWPFGIVTAWSTTATPPQVRVRFTEFSILGTPLMYHFYGYSADAGSHDFRDCQFHAGYFWTESPTLNVTNCLFNRAWIGLAESSPLDVTFLNCTFVGSDMVLANAGASTWTFKNNLFDGTTNSYVDGTFTHGYNAYTTNATRLTPTNANDIPLSVTNISYAKGLLGHFYLPTNLTSHSRLFNTGSVSAASAGLYHYTTTTNQVKETNSIVDLGFHYVALNSLGQPVDLDLDGIPDYAEDKNGNGTLDAGETAFHDPVLFLADVLDYIKGSPPKRLDTNAVAYDSDTSSFGGGLLKATISSGADANDRLAVRNDGTNAAQIAVSGTNLLYGNLLFANFTGGSGATPLTINFNTNASNAAVQALARNLTFNNVSNITVASTRTVQFLLTDGQGGTNSTQVMTINVICPQAVDVMLVLDASNSMTNHFPQAKAAASNFVSRMDFSVDRAGLISFSENATLEMVLTNSATAVQNKINGLTNTSGTRLKPPIDLARTNLLGSTTNVLRLMLILSDGELFGETENEVKTAAQQAADAGIRIITIGFYTGETNYLGGFDWAGGTNLLRQIASSPQDYYFTPTSAQMQSNFVAVAQGLCRGVPEVALTNPAPNAIFYGPTNILLEADVFNDSSVVKVEFFEGGLKFGEDLVGPHHGFTWSNVVAGSYNLYARAVNNYGAEAFSPVINISVRQGPSVYIVSPQANTTNAAPNNLTLNAVVQDPDGYITNVNYYLNGSHAGSVATSPYILRLTNLLAGTYSVTAVCFDNHGYSNTSAVVTFYVTKVPPTVGFVTPTNGATFAYGGIIPVGLTAADADGVVTNVSLAVDGTLVGALTTSPYSFALSNLTVGSHWLRAIAKDNDGLSSTNYLTNVVASCDTQASMSSLSLTNDQIAGGSLFTVTLNLTGAAATGGQFAILSATPAVLDVPAILFIAAGQSSTNLVIRADNVPATNQCTLSVTLNGITKTTNVIIHPQGGSETLAVCGPMDVAVLLDNSGSMTNEIQNLKAGISNIINTIEAISGTNYRLGLVEVGLSLQVREQFVLNNRSSFITNLNPFNGGGSGTEPSHLAIDKVLNHTGGFTNGFREEARRLILLLTDEAPQTTDGVITIEETHAVAQQARNLGVEILAIDTASSPFPWVEQEVKDHLIEFATVSGGQYIKLPADGTGLSDSVRGYLSRCGVQGKMVFVRDAASPQEALASSPARLVDQFDLAGIPGGALQAYSLREGVLDIKPGTSVEFGLGLASTVGGTNFLGGAFFSTGAGLSFQDYSLLSRIPDVLLPEISASLGLPYALAISNLTLVNCGASALVRDDSQLRWPSQRDALVILVSSVAEVSPGRARSFAIAGSNLPVLGTWEVILDERVIAASGSPNGWFVEADWTPFKGVWVSPPINAAVRNGYEVRVNDPAQSISGSFLFGVAPGGYVLGPPVLLPIEASASITNGGGSISVTFRLDGPAPANGARIVLTSECTQLTNLPPYVLIAAGERTCATNFTMPPATTNYFARFKASYNGYRKLSPLIINQSCGSVPAMPLGLVATALVDRIQLTWNTNTAVTYSIFRSSASESEAVIFSGLKTNFFVDYTAKDGVAYYYGVAGLNVCGVKGGITTPRAYISTLRYAQIVRPQIIPAGGIFNDSVQMIVTNVFAGATNFWTTNGNIPTEADFKTNVLVLTNNAIVRAKSFRGAGTNSDVASASFTILRPIPISCNTSNSGSLGPSNAWSMAEGAGWYGQRFSFTGTAGNLIKATTYTTNLDTRLYLFDQSSTNVLAGNDDYQTNDLTSQILFVAPSNGTYVLEVTTFQPLDQGTFGLDLKCNLLPELEVLTNSVVLTNLTALRFPTATLGTNVTLQIGISNAGLGSLTLSNVTAAPTNYVVSGSFPWTVASGAKTNLTVTLAADFVGQISGYLTITSDDALDGGLVENPFHVLLSGEVIPAPAKPQVELVFPTNGMVISQAPVDIQLYAAALDADGIQRVDFYQGTTLLGGTNVAPYTLWWSNATANIHALTAVARDNFNNLSTSAVVNLTVGSPAITLSPTNPCVGLSNGIHAVTATVRNVAGATVAGASVSFAIAGAHVTNAVRTTDGSGIATFLYTNRNPGLDTIQASTTVSSQPAAAIPVTKGWAGLISCGANLNGNLATNDAFSLGCGCSTPSRYADYYSFTGSAGDVVTFLMTTTNLETLMFLLNTNCQALATNEYLNATNSRLRFTLPANGTYIVEATSFDLYKTGNYALNMTCGSGGSAPDIALRMGGTNVPNGTWIDFGVTNVNQPILRSLIISNPGNATLSIAAQTIMSGFTIMPSAVTNITAGGHANFTLQFSNHVSAQYAGSLALTNNDADENPFILNLKAIANPAGAAPTVTLTAPTNNAKFIVPGSIPVTAIASATGATITNVDFVFTTSLGSFLIGRGTNATNTMTWNMDAPGAYALTAIARDSVGRFTVSAPVQVELQPQTQNHSPVANRDTATVAANSLNNLIDVLANDTDADADRLTIVNVFSSTNGTAEIVNNQTAIRYTPRRGIRGTDGFTYRITDGKGGFSSAVAVVTLEASDVPVVTITSPSAGSTVTAGNTVSLQAQVSPWLNVTNVEFWMGPVKIAQVTNGSSGTYSVNWTAVTENCHCGLTAWAFDRFGQRGVSQTIALTVNPPNDSSLPPVARFDNLISPLDYQGVVIFTNLATIREGVLDVFGRAYDEDSSDDAWQLRLYATDGSLVKDITPAPTDANGFRAGAVGSSTASNLLATCDLSTVRNGIYELVLRARGGYRTTETRFKFRLESDLKIGQFSFSEQDLLIPVNGMPLSVVRTYDSQNPKSGDFGYGWSYSVLGMEIELNEERIPVLEADDTPFSLRVGGGRDVTLTLPNGRRATFAFQFVQTQCGSGQYGSYCYAPSWQAPPGINVSLTAIGDHLFNAFTGMWQTDGTTSFEWYEFPGYILTLGDGTRYIIEREKEGDFYPFTDQQNEMLDEIDSGSYSATTYGAPYLSKVIQRTGDTIEISRDQVVNGKRTFQIQHRDPAGTLTRAVYLERNAAGQISAIRDPLSGSNGLAAVKYEYDSAGNLSKVLKLVNRTTQAYLTNSYFYENAQYPHYVTKIVDARGQPAARQLYDGQGRLTGIIDASGRTNRFEHNVAGRAETVFDREGNQTVHAYDTRGNVTSTTDALGNTMQRVFDTNNYVVREIDPLSNITSYAHDEKGNQTAVTNALGQVTQLAYNSFSQVLSVVDPLGHGVTNAYDAQGNLTNAVDALGHATTLVYDSLGRIASQRDATGALTTNRYDLMGNLTNVVTTGAGGASNFTSYAFDVNGNRTNEVSVRTLPGGAKQSATNSFVYDALNRVVMTLDALGSTNRTLYNEIGQVAATVNSRHVTNLMVYDERGLSVSNIMAWGLAEQSVETSAYDGNARRTLATDRLGRQTQFIYDAAGRLVQTIHPDGTTNKTVHDPAGRARETVDARGASTRFGFDAAGRRVAVTNALGQASYSTFDAAGNLILSADAGGRFVEFEHDALNRRARTLFMAPVIGQSRPAQTVGYDALGRAVARTNEAGVVTRLGYDALGRMTAVTNAWGTSDATWATYAFDERGNQTNQVDALGRRTRFEFDVLGRRLRRVLPNGQWEGFAYDVVGNLLRHTNFNGQIITNLFDAQNRLLGRWHGSTNLESYTYNAAGQRIARTDASGSYSWVYDTRGRVRTNMTPVGVLYYNYDANGNLTSLQSGTAGGMSVTYQYDLLNRLTNVIDQGLSGTKNTAYRFDAIGNLAALQYPNGVRGEWQYDARDRLTNQTWKGNASTLASFSYQLGAAGNRTNLSDSVNGTNRSFSWGYDRLYRLTNETISGAAPTGTINYRMDAVGNRTNRTSGIAGILTTNNYFDANDWLDIDSTTNNGSAWFDANGNTRTNGATTYLYDWANRLTNANNGAVVITYDADGHRMKKVAGGVTTLYLVSTINPSGYAQVVEELTVSGGFTNLSRIYSYGLDLISQRQGSAVYFFGTDGLGSTRLLTDTSGGTANTFAYDAFGTLIASNGPPQTAYLFAREQLDFDLGIYYNRARYVDQNSGRFLSRDTFEGNNSDPLSLHKYLYASANPVNLIDPSGHEYTLTGTLTTVGNIGRLATQIAIRAITVKSRVDSAVDGFNAVQQVAAGLEDGLDEDDFEAVLGLAQDYLIERLKSKLIGGALGVAARGASQAAAAARTGITSLGRGRINFRGFEVRAARDMSHIDESTLRTMKKDGFAATTKNGDKIDLHHLNQNPNGPLVEIPRPNHKISNPRQHPNGNTPGGGLTDAQRAEFDAWRESYWKARATEELMRRGINPDL